MCVPRTAPLQRIRACYTHGYLGPGRPNIILDYSLQSGQY